MASVGTPCKFWRPWTSCVLACVLVFQCVLVAFSSACFASPKTIAGWSEEELCLHDPSAAPTAPTDDGSRRQRDCGVHCICCISSPVADLPVPGAAIPQLVPTGTIQMVFADWGRELSVRYCKQQPRAPPDAMAL
jgi:hypothetical protein